MKIKHDFEYYQNMINDIKTISEGIENLNQNIDEISEMVKKFDLNGAEAVLRNAIFELDEKLIYTIHPTIEGFVETLEESSNLFEEGDNSIAKKLNT